MDDKAKRNGIIIYGIGPISKTIFYSSRKNGQFEVSGFTADCQYITSNTFCGKPVISFERVELVYPPDQFDMLVVNVGHVAGAISRKVMFQKALKKGYNFINYIDGKADVTEDVVMGQNNIIMSNTHIGPTGIMGDNNFIRENIYLAHDFNIGSHNFLAGGCNFGGTCVIGDLNFIGIATTVINNIEIQDGNFLGAGSLVVKDIGSRGLYMGHPAKRIRDHAGGTEKIQQAIKDSDVNAFEYPVSQCGVSVGN